MWQSALEEGSIAYIVLRNWLPGLLTVVAGGFMASIIFPKLQKNALRVTKIEEKKVAIAEEVVQCFNRYIVSWRRLIQISELEAQRTLTGEEADRKTSFVLERNERRDKLFDKLNLCQLYFCEGVCKQVSLFFEWDELQSSKSLVDLPEIHEWRLREAKIIDLIKDEITN